MNTKKTIYSLGIVLLVAAAIRPTYAENNDMTQTRTQDHLREQVSMQTPSNELGRASNSEQNMVINKNQNQYQHQYKHMNNLSAEQSSSGKGSGSAMSGSTNRYNTMNRYSQNNGSGSMSRQSSSARSSGGGGGGRR